MDDETAKIGELRALSSRLMTSARKLGGGDGLVDPSALDAGSRRELRAQLERESAHGAARAQRARANATTRPRASSVAARATTSPPHAEARTATTALLAAASGSGE